MEPLKFKQRVDGRSSVTLEEHADCIIRVLNPGANPHRKGTHRAMGWEAVSRMDGMTVAQAHDELRRLEPVFQRRVGRPLGWLVRAVDAGNVAIYPSAAR